MRVVFDTNVFVSALVMPGSLSDEAYRRAIGQEFELVTSVAILTELAGKLRAKFGWESVPITRAIKAISRVGEVVKTVPHLDIARDPADNRVLECAEKAGADLIVTGDRHLLKMRRFGRTGIVKVSTFLHSLGAAVQ
ncbi:MAG: putative toxin-antitoxin system toxin component, PIN family [Candidatus Rokuibacteriota bacterium]|nr:MAG: putative toxin-antitoxin system toxin component, PIN family [Candidatus Rokubacteria bacterium]